MSSEEFCGQSDASIDRREEILVRFEPTEKRIKIVDVFRDFEAAKKEVHRILQEFLRGIGICVVPKAKEARNDPIEEIFAYFRKRFSEILVVELRHYRENCVVVIFESKDNESSFALPVLPGSIDVVEL